MNQRRHQRKPKNFGTSRKEAGTKCSDDTREEETRKQCLFPPPHPPPSAQGLLKPRGHSFLPDWSSSRNLSSLFLPLGCPWPQEGRIPPLPCCPPAPVLPLQSEKCS